MKLTRILLALALLGVTTFGTTQAAGLGLLPFAKKGGCHQQVECPCCHCELKIEEATMKKHCWEVETKPICVPHVTLPIFGHVFGRGKGCGELGENTPYAKVKHVRVLKKVEYECKHCQCKWTPVCDHGDCGKGVSTR